MWRPIREDGRTGAPVWVLDVPVRRVGEATCDPLPGAAMETERETLLPAPMPGSVARYADQWGDLTLQIENPEWTVWVLGMRSVLASGTEVQAGQPLGMAGGKGRPFYVVIYDRVRQGFVGHSFVSGPRRPARWWARHSNTHPQCRRGR